MSWEGGTSGERSSVGGGFGAGWTGQIQPKFSETYTFYLRANGQARLWIDGELLIDNPQALPNHDAQGTIALQAGSKYDIRVDYSKKAGERALTQLRWSSAHQARQLIPKSALL